MLGGRGISLSRGGRDKLLGGDIHHEFHLSEDKNNQLGMKI